jgi:hypothetical protein
VCVCLFLHEMPGAVQAVVLSVSICVLMAFKVVPHRVPSAETFSPHHVCMGTEKLLLSFCFDFKCFLPFALFKLYIVQVIENIMCYIGEGMHIYLPRFF